MLLDDPIATVSALPAIVLPIFILVSAGLEYVFPPYWGDLFVLVGFFLAGQGATSPVLLFFAALLGSMLGAASAFWLGHHYGLQVIIRITARRRRARTGTSKRMRRLFRRFGERVLIANRFLPFVRGLMLFGAGAFDLRFWPSMLFCLVSNFAWLGIMASLGLVSADNWEDIQSAFQRYSLTFGVASTVLVLAWLGWTWWRSTHPRRAAEIGPDH